MSDEQVIEEPVEQVTEQETEEQQDSGMSPEEKAEMFDRAAKAEETARAALRKWTHAKAVAKQAKEDYEVAQQEVHDLAGAGMEEFPLLDGAEKAAEQFVDTVNGLVEDGKVDSVTVSTGTQPVTIGRPADDKWREHSIGAVPFSEKERDLLEAAEINTLGQLQDLMDQNGEDWGKGRGIHGNVRKRIDGKMKEYFAEISSSAS